MKGQTEHSHTNKRHWIGGRRVLENSTGAGTASGDTSAHTITLRLIKINDWKEKGRKENFQSSPPQCIEHCSFFYFYSAVPHRKHTGHFIDLEPSSYQLLLMLCWICCSQTRRTCGMMQRWRAALAAVAMGLWSLRSWEEQGKQQNCSPGIWNGRFHPPRGPECQCLMANYPVRQRAPGELAGVQCSNGLKWKDGGKSPNHQCLQKVCWSKPQAPPAPLMPPAS